MLISQSHPSPIPAMTGSPESLVLAFWSGMTCYVGDPGDRRWSDPLGSSHIIPDWRRVQVFRCGPFAYSVVRVLGFSRWELAASN
jgi:hypothetical protein